MTSDILQRIEAVRAELNSLPNGITIGELPEGTQSDSVLLDKSPVYRDFIRSTDGARMGVADFYFLSDLPKHQTAAGVLPVAVGSNQPRKSGPELTLSNGCS